MRPLTPSDFRGQMEHERRLTDRNGAPFAVLVMPVRETGEQRTIRRIRSLVRATDSVGWVSEGELGILLRNCHVSTGVRLAEELLSYLDADAGDRPCTLYPYPPPVAETRPS